jgi:signal transduction histidine kinase
MFRNKPRSSRKLLLTSFGVVVVCFMSSTYVSERQNASIRDAAESIITNSSPSIVTLAQARSVVERIEVNADDDVDDAEAKVPPKRRRDVDASRAKLDALWARYRTLPSYAPERGIWPDAEADRMRLEQALNRTYAAIDANAPKDALAQLEGDVKPAARSLDRSLERLVEVNAKEGVLLAAQIEHLNKRASLLAVLLDVLAALLAALVAYLVIRAVRRSERVDRSRIEELEQFAGRVAHDVLGPLSAVSMSLGVIAKTAEGRPHDVALRGLKSLVRVERIVHDLLEFARAGARPQDGARCEVAPVLSGVLEELWGEAERARVELATEPFRGATVACGVGILTSILENLIRNAIKYMGDSEVRRVTVRVLDAGDEVRFEVEDTGPGVARGQEARVFEPYVRGASSAQPGIGLGLATVKRVVEAHGGRVGLSSRHGGGACFWFRLRRAELAEPAPAADAAHASA